MGDIEFRGLRATGAIRIGDNSKLSSMMTQTIGDVTYEFYNPADIFATRVGLFADGDSGTILAGQFNSTYFNVERHAEGDEVHDDDGSGHQRTVLVGNPAVAIGNTEAETVSNFRDAINAVKPGMGAFRVAAFVDPVDGKVLRLVADRTGEGGNITISNTVGDSSYSQSGAALAGGVGDDDQFLETGVYTVTALDVLAGNVMIPLVPPNPRNLLVQYRKSTGEEHLSITDKATLTGGFLRVAGAGATHLAATDEVHYQVMAPR